MHVRESTIEQELIEKLGQRLTPAPTPAPNSVPTRCRAGFIITTGIDHMPASATDHPSPASN